jgi:hypothetical protein
MEETCGGCRFFKTTRERDDGRLGECRLSKVMGVFHENMRACGSFTRAGVDLPETTSAPPAHRRTVAGPSPQTSRVSSATLVAALTHIGPEALRAVLADALAVACHSGSADLGRTWTSGELQLWPRDDELKPKQMPLDSLFHKLVMIRDNLRVMEQKINSHEHLQDAEKLDLQRQVSLAYHSVLRLATGFLERPAFSSDPAGEATDLLRMLRTEVERHGFALRPPALGERWSGGEARYVREGETITESLDLFFHRVVAVRDRLMGLEALLGAHPHVAPDEADAMCAYIRRCYGSLTSFNVLFRDREDYFTSTR